MLHAHTHGHTANEIKSKLVKLCKKTIHVFNRPALAALGTTHMNPQYITLHTDIDG